MIAPSPQTRIRPSGRRGIASPRRAVRAACGTGIRSSVAPNPNPLNEGRASAIEFVDHPLFSQSDFEDEMETYNPGAKSTGGRDFAPTPARLCDAPLLTRADERYLFLKMNGLKAVAARLDASDTTSNAEVRRAITSRLAAANAIRNRIVEANLRLVVSVARKFVTPDHPLDELVGEGSIPLLRAVELFDISKGYAFSTYATNALRHHYFRSSKRRARRHRQSGTTNPGVLAEIADHRSQVVDPVPHLARTRTMTTRLLGRLPERERRILAARFGLDEFGQSHTFSQIAELLNLSKERVRVLANRALEQMREEAENCGLELPVCA